MTARFACLVPPLLVALVVAVALVTCYVDDDRVDATEADADNARLARRSSAQHLDRFNFQLDKYAASDDDDEPDQTLRHQFVSNREYDDDRDSRYASDGDEDEEGGARRDQQQQQQQVQVTDNDQAYVTTAAAAAAAEDPMQQMPMLMPMQPADLLPPIVLPPPPPPPLPPTIVNITPPPPPLPQQQQQEQAQAPVWTNMPVGVAEEEEPPLPESSMSTAPFDDDLNGDEESARFFQNADADDETASASARQFEGDESDDDPKAHFFTNGAHRHLADNSSASAFNASLGALANASKNNNNNNSHNRTDSSATIDAQTTNSNNSSTSLTDKPNNKVGPSINLLFLGILLGALVIALVTFGLIMKFVWSAVKLRREKKQHGPGCSTPAVSRPNFALTSDAEETSVYDARTYNAKPSQHHHHQQQHQNQHQHQRQHDLDASATIVPSATFVVSEVQPKFSTNNV